MSDARGAEAPGRSTTRWASLASFAVCTFYASLVLWLAVWVVVPTAVMRWQPMLVSSGSMEPLVRVGDVVLVGDADTEGLGAGTVITFEDSSRDGALVTHRIAGVNDDGTYRTRGDANNVDDATAVTPDSIVGVGRLLVPMIGAPLVWLRTGSAPLFLLWAIVTAIAIVIASRAPEDETDPRDPDDGDRVAPGPDPDRERSPLVRRLRRAPGTAATTLEAATRAVPARTAPSWLRAWGPTIITLLGTAATAVAGSAFATCVGLALTTTLLISDPGGPELRIGRWLRSLRRLRGAAAASLAPLAARLPRPRFSLELPAFRPAFATTALLSIVAVAVIPHTGAAFTGATANVGNTWQAGTWAPPPPPPPPPPPAGPVQYLHNVQTPATPVVRASSTATAGLGTSVSLTVPAGAANDVLVVTAVGTGADTWAPAGFTRHSTIAYSKDAALRLTTWTKLAGGETSVPVTKAAGQTGMLHLLRVGNVAGATPAVVSQAAPIQGAGHTDVTVAGVTATSANTLLVGAAGGDADRTWTGDPMAEVSETSTADVSLGSYVQVVGSGATGPRTFTATGNPSLERAAHLLAFTPAMTATASAATNPLTADPTAPTATTLLNYSTDNDARVGRHLAPCVSGCTAAGQVAIWQAPALTAARSGTARLDLWIADASATATTGTVVAQFGYRSGGTFTSLGQQTWPVTGAGFEAATFTFPEMSLAAGVQPEVQVWTMAAGVDLAYDTTTYPAAVTLP